MIVENVEQLRERFALSYTGYWRCMECGVRILRTANLAAHECAGRRELHAQMLDVPTYTCRKCGWSVEEPKLPFEHRCSSDPLVSPLLHGARGDSSDADFIACDDGDPPRERFEISSAEVGDLRSQIADLSEADFRAQSEEGVSA